MALRTVDRVAVDARAAACARRSIKGLAKSRGLRLAIALMDLTTLEGKDSPEKVRALCRKALRPDPQLADIPAVAAVCVYPRLVAAAKEVLAGSTVRIASAATAFPSGQASLQTRLADTEEAVGAGADEVDMVISRGAFLAGRRDLVAEEIREVKAACGRARLKVILETGELETYDNVRAAAEIALHNGADFLKTSTGKSEPAATPGATLILLEAAREHARATGRLVGVKAAGGIRTAKQALHYLVMVKETVGDAWLCPDLFRFGATSLLNDLLMQIRRQATGAYSAAYDVTEA
jgi:deoxyribose-phosphate aldolase